MNELFSCCRDMGNSVIVANSPGRRSECGHLPISGSTIIEGCLSADVNG